MVAVLEGNYEIICVVEVFLEDQKATFFRDGTAVLKHRWTDCIDVKGDYIEKCEQRSCFSNSFWVRSSNF